MKLNGWQRIGIVLTIIWMIGAFLNGLNAEVEDTKLYAHTQFSICVDNLDKTKGFHLDQYGECEAVYGRAYRASQDAFRRTFWTSPKVATAYAYPLFGWIFTYLVIGIAKWIWRGFVKTAQKGA